MNFNDIKKFFIEFRNSPGKALLYLVILCILLYGGSFLVEKGRNAAENVKTERPFLSIESDTISFEEWTEKDIMEDPEITSRCDKVLLFFNITNTKDIPAKVTEINAMSRIIQEKKVGNFTPSKRKMTFYGNGEDHHQITSDNPGRQPYNLSLDKKVVEYFKNGVIKVQLDIEIVYESILGGDKYWTKGSYMYSPVYEDYSKEISSSGI